MNMSSLQSKSKSPKRANLVFSPDVELPLRHRCRNARCRCKLPAPVTNEKDAFCCRGCFESHYRKICVVCEKAFARKRDDQATCGRPKCQRALRLYPEQFLRKWVQVPAVNVKGSETLINRASKAATGPRSQPNRPWRQRISLWSPDQLMSPEALRLATLGPERIIELERSQRALIEVHLHNPDTTRAAEREALYIAAVRRFRDRGYGKPVAAPASRYLTSCNWAPALGIDPAGVPDVPESLRRQVTP
jgi:hypothetical protein